MLRSENFRGRHEGDLIAIFDDDRGCFEGHDGFAATDVAFEEAVHGERTFEIACDFDEHAFLCGRGLKRQDALYGIADFSFTNAHGNAALGVMTRPAKRESQLIVEKFLEDQTSLRGAPKAIEQIDVFILGREVGEEDRVATRGKFVAFADLRRERIGNITFEIGEDSINNFAKHARADCADGFVDGNDAANLGGICGAAFRCADGFDLRIHHFEACWAVRIDFHFAVQDKALAFFHAAFKIGAVEKARMESARTVAKCDVEDGWASASEADGGASTGGYLCENGVNLAGDNFSNFGEADTVFVTEGEIAEKVAGGEESAFLQHGGAVRANATEKFYWSCQGDAHAFKVFVRCWLIRVIELPDIYNIFVRTAETRHGEKVRYLTWGENFLG